MFGRVRVLFALLMMGLPLVLGAGSAEAAPLGISSAPVQVSQCAGQNAEVEEAAAGNFVYDLWMGCGPGGTAIGFARSTDSGQTFGPSITVPGSFSSSNANSTAWDPAIAVGPDGTVYASFMFYNADTNATYPVVAASFDHGKTFSQVSSLPIPPITDPEGNWGDRDFIAVGPTGTIYVTWDYGPSYSVVKFICAPDGSCGFSAGDLNIVVQKSTDGAKTWTSVTPVSPGFPTSGADSGPVLVQPDGTIDVLYQGFPTHKNTLRLSPGGEYFTRSSDGGQTWSAPVPVGASVGTESLAEWWIDGDIATDSAGNLYATWDTQSATTDVGWLSYSTDGGRTWSDPIRVTPDQGNSEELIEVTGAQPGVAYVAWQTPAAPAGYATYIRPFSIQHGWLTASPAQVSGPYGDPSIWPGDTFGITTLGPASQNATGPPAILSWGSAVNGNTNSEIFSATTRFSP